MKDQAFCGAAGGPGGGEQSESSSKEEKPGRFLCGWGVFHGEVGLAGELREGGGADRGWGFRSQEVDFFVREFGSHIPPHPGVEYSRTVYAEQYSEARVQGRVVHMGENIYP